MMGLFSKIFRRRFIGSVEAGTQFVDDDGNSIPGERCLGVYHLFTKRLRRSYKLVGNHGGSVAAIKVEAEVKAWAAGGPLPEKFVPVGDTLEEKQTKVVIKEGNILSFPQGKGETK